MFKVQLITQEHKFDLCSVFSARKVTTLHVYDQLPIYSNSNTLGRSAGVSCGFRFNSSIRDTIFCNPRTFVTTGIDQLVWWPWYGLSEIQIPVGVSDFSLLQIFRTGSRPPSLLFNGYRGLFPRGRAEMGVNLTTHLHLLPRLRMCGAIPLFPIHAFIA